MGDSSQVHETLISMTSDIVAAHVSHNSVALDRIPVLIQTVFQALSGVGTAPAEETVAPAPAVSIRASVKPDYVACLECGRKLKMLKRHLGTEHGLTVAEYRQRWNLASDYPVIAPNYTKRRSNLAKQMGLGVQRVRKSEEPQARTTKAQGERKRAKLTLWRGKEEDASLAPATPPDHGTTMQPPSEPAASSEKKLIEAIARLRVVTAGYNGSEMRLAPHQLFSRHGELFVSALNTRKNWRSDDERRLGHFKVSGLSSIALTDDTFEPLPSFDGSLPREGDEQLFAVSPS